MERFLREKYGLPLTGDEGTADGELVEIIDAEIVNDHPEGEETSPTAIPRSTSDE